MERNNRATMRRVKANIESLMTFMENALVAKPIPLSPLRRRWTKAETNWSQYLELFDQLYPVTY